MRLRSKLFSGTMTQGGGTYILETDDASLSVLKIFWGLSSVNRMNSGFPTIEKYPKSVNVFAWLRKGVFGLEVEGLVNVNVMKEVTAETSFASSSQDSILKWNLNLNWLTFYHHSVVQPFLRSFTQIPYHSSIDNLYERPIACLNWHTTCL